MKTITGKWNLAGFDGIRWELVEMRRDQHACHGILVEWYGERIVNQTIYVWYPAENELVIDRSNVVPDGFMRVCYEERFRIEIAGNSLYLYAFRKEW